MTDMDLAGAREVGIEVLVALTGSGAHDFDSVGTTKVKVPGLTFGTVDHLANACSGTRVDMRLRIIAGESHVVVSVFGVKRLVQRRVIRRQLSRRLAECLRASFRAH